MGGDLGPAPEGKSPTFLVAALKDPIGANLDRIQIVKGWVDAKGELQRSAPEARFHPAQRAEVGEFLQAIEDHDDVQNVYANLETDVDGDEARA